MSKLLPDTKRNLLQTLFERAAADVALKEYDDYFDLFDAEIEFLNDTRFLIERSLKVTNEQLVQIALEAVPAMRASPEAKRESFVNSLRTSINGQQNDAALTDVVNATGVPKSALDYVLDSVIRLWLMINPASESTRKGWEEERKLCDFVYGTFYPYKPAPGFPVQGPPQAKDTELAAEMSAENTQIQSNLTRPLTAANMHKLTNITTEWCKYLDRHLEFDADHKNLSVFPHNRWLLDALSIVEKWREQHAAPPPQM